MKQYFKHLANVRRAHARQEYAQMCFKTAVKVGPIYFKVRTMYNFCRETRLLCILPLSRTCGKARRIWHMVFGFEWNL